MRIVGKQRVGADQTRLVIVVSLMRGSESTPERTDVRFLDGVGGPMLLSSRRKPVILDFTESFAEAHVFHSHHHADRCAQKIRDRENILTQLLRAQEVPDLLSLSVEVLDAHTAGRRWDH